MKANIIEFVKPGRGTVHAIFELDDVALDALRAGTANGDKVLRWFAADIIDAQGELVARTRKQVYLRRKPGRRRAIDASPSYPAGCTCNVELRVQRTN